MTNTRHLQPWFVIVACLYLHPVERGQSGWVSWVMNSTTLWWEFTVEKYDPKGQRTRTHERSIDTRSWHKQLGKRRVRGNEALALTDFQCTVADEVQRETLLRFPQEVCSVVKNMAVYAAHSPPLPSPLWTKRASKAQENRDLWELPGCALKQVTAHFWEQKLWSPALSASWEVGFFIWHLFSIYLQSLGSSCDFSRYTEKRASRLPNSTSTEYKSNGMPCCVSSRHHAKLNFGLRSCCAGREASTDLCKAAGREKDQIPVRLGALGLPIWKEVDVGGIVSGRANGLDIGFLVELG